MSVNASSKTRRIRLSQWAREQGIAWVTAHRMVKKGILPVPAEMSPTGRWYVNVPHPHEHGIMAMYIQTMRGEGQQMAINAQIERLSRWAAHQRRHIAVTVKEVVNPATLQRPKLGKLLADRQISDIAIDNVDVIGRSTYPLLAAALHAENRAIIIADERMGPSAGRRAEIAREIITLCRDAYPERIAAQIEALIGIGHND